MKEIYLDNNATTNLLKEVKETLVLSLEDFLGNPSSAHSLGERARERLHHARLLCASLIQALPEKLIFTGSGTESNALVLHSSANTQKQAHLATTAIEHSATLKYCKMLEKRGHQITYIPVDSDGLVSLDNIKRVLEKHPALISLQWVSNETGVMQPIERIAELCVEAGVPLHTDAAQAVGKIKINLQETPISYLSFTGHKLHAPAGVGVLYAEAPKTLTPLLFGGGQEEGIRPGTENMLGIIGLGRACELRNERFDEIQAQLTEMRDRLENIIQQELPDVFINGNTTSRVCNTTNIRFVGVDGELLVARLDQAGVYCSQSSACTSGIPEPSYVLRAMGLSEEEAYASIRFSVSVDNSLEEMEKAASIIVEQYRDLRKIMG